MKSLKYKFIEKEYPVSGLLPDIGISNIFHNFMTNEIFKGEHIGIITKVKTIDGNIFTIGKKSVIKPSLPQDIIEYSEYINDRSLWMESWYTTTNLVSIIFIYSEISEVDYSRIKNLFLIDKNKNSLSYLSNNKNISLPYNIPLNNKYLEWGDEVNKENKITKITGIRFNPNLRGNIYILIKNINSKEVLVTFNSIKDNTVLFYFSDCLNLNQLIRYYNNKKFIIENEKIVLYLNSNNKTEYIKKTVKSTKNTISSKLMTLDIETYLNDKKEMHLYCLSIYNGKVTKSYFLNDFNNVSDLLDKVFKEL